MTDKVDAQHLTMGQYFTGTEPIVSVIIPSYNCAEFLQEAIESALCQSFRNFELIVVDDGSTDGTQLLMESYRNNFRVRYIYQDNRGLPAARNCGFRHAAGKFIAVLDADDALAPAALEDMLQAVRVCGASWCIVDILKFWEGYSEVRKTILPAGDLWLGILNDDFPCRAMFFRRETLERVGAWDESMRMREDWDLNIRLIDAQEKFAYLSRPLYHYRKRPGSITTGDPRLLLTYTERVLRKHHKQAADLGNPAVARIYAAKMWDLARQQFYRRKDLVQTVRCLKESLSYETSLYRLFHPILHSLSRLSH